MVDTLQRWLEFLAPAIAVAALIAGLYFCIQGYRGRRRLRALGFRREDFKSPAQFFESLGKIMQSNLPERIKFDSISAHGWSDPQKHRACESALINHGFLRIGMFVAIPQEWVAEFWMCESQGDCGIVADSQIHGPYLDLMSWYEDGTYASFVNHPTTGLCRLDEQHVAHCGYIPPEELISRWLPQRPKKNVKPMTPANIVEAYEQMANDHLARHRKDGFSGKQVKDFLEFRGKYKK